MTCRTCNGTGYHPAAQQVVRTFWRMWCLPGEDHWNNKITDDEAAALIAAERVPKGETADSINSNRNRHGGPGAYYMHDDINRGILISARLRRLDLPERCPTCEGKGELE